MKKHVAELSETDDLYYCENTQQFYITDNIVSSSKTLLYSEAVELNKALNNFLKVNKQ